MGRCVYCKKYTTEKGITFHRFPGNETEKKKWAENMGRLDFLPGKTAVLCSDHFTSDCFERWWNITRLRKGSVPTIFSQDRIEAHTTCDVGQALSKRLKVDMSLPTTSPPSTSMDQPRCTEESSSAEAILPTLSLEMSTPSYSILTPKSATCQEQLTPRTSRRRELFKHDHHYEDTPRTRQKKCYLIRQKYATSQKKIRALKRQVHNLKATVHSLKQVVSMLDKKKLVSESVSYILSSFSDTPLSIFTRMLKNQKTGKLTREQYPPQLRCFALTLHFYSPKAYDFVRKTFELALPHPDVIRTWYTSVDAEPGFVEDCFSTLKYKVDRAGEKGEQITCALLMDEMGIKKGSQRGRDGKQRGHVDVGTGLKVGDDLPEAKDSFVFMVVPLNSDWKLPIGYFLVNGLSAETKVNMVRECLIRLEQVGVKVCSLTMDGPPDHFSMLTKLGGNLDKDSEKFQPYFPHPIATEPIINVFFDPCHMIKNIRNCLAEYQILLDENGAEIMWEYIVALAELQEKEGLRLGNKLRTRHIDYKKMIMKVFLAAQTLSSSVADAIEFCWSVLKLPQFKGCEATVRFIRCIDCIFDFLNVRNPWGKGYKAPLKSTNEHVWRPRIMSELNYLGSIKQRNGSSIFTSRRKAGFIGFYTAVLSAINVYEFYVKTPDSSLTYLTTYKMSQDHLELFFCAIRGRSGWCPNPTALQFISAFKRLLVRHDVQVSTGNIQAMDNTKILNVSSAKKEVKVDKYDVHVYDEMDNLRVQQKYNLDETPSSFSSTSDVLNEFLEFAWSMPSSLSEFSEQTIGYIAGFVARKLRTKIKCPECLSACESVAAPNDMLNRHNRIALILSKSRGGLTIPSLSIITICTVAEKFFRRACNANMGKPPVESNFPAVLASAIFHDLLLSKCDLFPELEGHVTDMFVVQEFSHHVHKLIKTILATYIELRLYALTKNHALSVTGTNVRHFLNRQIIWANQ